MVRQSLLSRRAAASAQRRCLSRNAGRWCLIDTETGQIKTPNGPGMTIFSPDGRHGYLRYTVARIADGHPISRISRCRSITQDTFCSDTVGLGRVQRCQVVLHPPGGRCRRAVPQSVRSLPALGQLGPLFTAALQLACGVESFIGDHRADGGQPYSARAFARGGDEMSRGARTLPRLGDVLPGFPGLHSLPVNLANQLKIISQDQSQRGFVGIHEPGDCRPSRCGIAERLGSL